MAILATIEQPSDIKTLSASQLDVLSQEIREVLINTISKLGGHLASSLGAVELCLALHAVFDAPNDHLIWDMGYQAFAHKLITGRRQQFATLKQLGGLSGFNNKDESPYDLFTTGHGGTVLSTALGIAMAVDGAPAARHTVAIIGDASLGEGMALEALNHIGHVKPNLLVVLNDNRMSIAKPVGGLSRYLNRIIINPTYNKFRDELEERVARLPHGSRLVRIGHKLEEALKGLIVPGIVFEELGFRYVGPIDGHNLPELLETLQKIKQLTGPILLHVSTVKGKGYRFAEEDPERFHKIEPFDIETGQMKGQGTEDKGQGKIPATFSEAFSEELVRLGGMHPKLFAITAAMPEGTGVSEFASCFPQRCLDVGMAEQHAVGLAAGLVRGGSRAVVAIYSTFLQRAFDQIMHEVCLQELPVILAIDRAGLVGEDGPTHHGVFDVAYLRMFPRIAILSPKDPLELQMMLRWALESKQPVAIRYSRGGIVCGTPLGASKLPIRLGEAETLRSGKDIALLALGSMVYPALAVAEALAKDGLEATVINARFVKPLDPALIQHAAQIGAVVTLEEAQVAGGFGSAVSEALAQLPGLRVAHHRIGLPDAFIEHGKREELLRRCELDPESLTRRIRQWYQTTRMAPTPSAPDALRTVKSSS